MNKETINYKIPIDKIPQNTKLITYSDNKTCEYNILKVCKKNVRIQTFLYRENTREIVNNTYHNEAWKHSWIKKPDFINLLNNCDYYKVYSCNYYKEGGHKEYNNDEYYKITGTYYMDDNNNIILDSIS